jgi:hypothetical protein
VSSGERDRSALIVALPPRADAPPQADQRSWVRNFQDDRGGSDNMAEKPKSNAKPMTPKAMKKTKGGLADLALRKGIPQPLAK